MKKNPIMIIICGLPSSGKTTFANSLKRAIEIENEFNYKNTIIIDIDEIRKEIYKTEFEPEKEKEVRQKAINLCEYNLLKGNCVIVDDINYYSSMRHNFINLAIKHDIIYFIIYISTPKEVCKTWNAKRGYFIPNDLIDQISDRFEIPGKKYKWDRPFLNINLNEISIEKANTIFIKKLKEYIFNTDKIKKNNFNISQKCFNLNIVKLKSEELINRIDYITRKFITFYVKLIIEKKPNEMIKKYKLDLDKLGIIIDLTEDNLKDILIVYSKIGKDIKKLNILRRNFILKIQNQINMNFNIYNILNLFLDFIKNQILI